MFWGRTSPLLGWPRSRHTISLRVSYGLLECECHALTRVSDINFCLVSWWETLGDELAWKSWPSPRHKISLKGFESRNKTKRGIPLLTKLEFMCRGVTLLAAFFLCQRSRLKSPLDCRKPWPCRPFEVRIFWERRERQASLMFIWILGSVGEDCWGSPPSHKEGPLTLFEDSAKKSIWPRTLCQAWISAGLS